MPEHTFALIFALRRSIVAYRESVKAGRWYDAQQFCYFDYPIQDLAGSTLGGGTVVNYMNCIRTPQHIREEWERHGIEGMASFEYEQHIDAINRFRNV